MDRAGADNDRCGEHAAAARVPCTTAHTSREVYVCAHVLDLLAASSHYRLRLLRGTVSCCPSQLYAPGRRNWLAADVATCCSTVSQSRKDSWYKHHLSLRLWITDGAVCRCSRLPGDLCWRQPAADSRIWQSAVRISRANGVRHPAVLWHQ